ncbi:hypothetical protein GFK26_18295 [Variovorax paradoxus]|uniref:Uncharacterized protein n=1 Tax=Variovorax paradoxus TaxID=34073 RepID=A0A5Q0M518_VARPD|nr:hypothetical protein [Variovorax paradoxus]QFZ84579.1 hypothetical protein GFK26_18295 [Variovorax paradoxus]
MKGVVYNNVRLMPGSTALELYEAGKKKELDQHMARLDHEDRQRSGVVKTAAQEHFDALLHPCCLNEKRGMNGGCTNCGDPCL